MILGKKDQSKLIRLLIPCLASHGIGVKGRGSQPLNELRNTKSIPLILLNMLLQSERNSDLSSIDILSSLMLCLNRNRLVMKVFSCFGFFVVDSKFQFLFPVYKNSFSTVSTNKRSYPKSTKSYVYSQHALITLSYERNL